MSNSKVDGISERNIQHAIVAILRWRGWMVREISQPHRVSHDLVGVPDLICFKNGITMLIECKAKGGRLRDSQKQFAKDITPHLRSTLWLIVADDVDAMIAKVDAIEGMAR